MNEYILNKVKSLEIPFDVINIEYFYIISKKRLCYTEGETSLIKTKGFQGSRADQKRFIEGLIIESRRNDRLLELGI
jgi:hypothetical protein